MEPVAVGDIHIEHLLTDREIVFHSTVVLSVIDHYERVAKGTNKRVIGTLLGEFISGTLHITNGFAVPFEEDSKDPTLYFLDHNYHESFYGMFRKINRKERAVGWYSTGPNVKSADIEIHEVYRRYCPNPVYAIVDVKPKDVGLPIKMYYSVEIPTHDQQFRRTFVHVSSSIGSSEIEEIGIEHLLRDLRNSTTSSLSTQIGDKLAALQSLIDKLRRLAAYLRDVVDGKLAPNVSILYNLQNIFNLLPDNDNEQLVRAFGVQTNDTLLQLYLGSVVRAVIALHNLINNILDNKKKVEDVTENSIAKVKDQQKDIATSTGKE